MPFSPSLVLLRTQSDDRLVALARQGSEAAFTAIVERYRRPLLSVCRRVLSEARAEDALQQTFVAAWRALERGDEIQQLRPWLQRIARNMALNTLRVPGYDAAELHESLRASEAPQAELERREVVRATLAGLAALPERQREALLRSALAGEPHADIARDLGLSAGATRQLVLRARDTLRAAAGGLVPWPVLRWLAAGGSPSSVRVAEIAAGAGGASATAAMAKAGTVAVLAGGAVVGPAVVDRSPDPKPARAAQPARPTPSEPDPGAAATGGEVAERAPATAGGGAEPRGARRSGSSGSDEDRSGRSGGDREDRSGPSEGREDRSGQSDDDEGEVDDDGSEDRSGPSDDEDDADGSGPSSGGGDDRSGPSDDEAGDHSSGPSGSSSGSTGSGSPSRSSGSGSADDADELDE